MSAYPPTAQLFVDACAARRWHQRANPRGVVPADLEAHAISARYLTTAISVAMDEDAGFTVVQFADGSHALRTSTSPWEVVEAVE